MRISGISNLREAYEASLRREGHQRDSAQDAVVTELERLQAALHLAASGRRRILDRLLKRSLPAATLVPGLYIWGGVGRGKTFLLDLFFETLALPAKKRIHFHRMMHDVHARLARLSDVADPVDRVAAEIARETHVLCFDEFFVSDIADAMLLGRLLAGLFQRGVTLVATSNSAPDELYRDGLQRQRFVPAIESLKQHTRVIHMAAGTDYRLRRLQQAGTFLTPHDAAAQEKLRRYFEASASSAVNKNRAIIVNGRRIHTQRCAKGIVWFDFKDVCDGPRSQDDYIEIARWYPTVILSAVPVFDAAHENQARRFIALVDEFYDRRVKLIVSAESTPDKLYRGRRLGFEFERTVSRLVEMQSTDYLAAPHLA